MPSKLTEDFIKRGLRGVVLSNGESLYETDIEMLTANILSILPSTDVRFDFLKATILDKFPDKGNWDNFMLLHHTDEIRYALEDGNKQRFAEALHHTFLLSGYILRQQGSKTDDLLHNMISYYEEYKIPRESLPYEIAKVKDDSAVSIQIDDRNYIRTVKHPYWEQRVLVDTTTQQTLTTKIQNNEL